MARSTSGYVSTVDRGLQSGFHGAMRDIERGPSALPPAFRQVLVSRQPHLARQLGPGATSQLRPRRHARAVLRGDSNPIGDDRPDARCPARAGPHWFLLSTELHRQYDGRDLAVAQDLARRTALAMENAQLYRDAREQFDDDLTGNFIAAPDGRLLACNSEFARMIGFDSPADATRQSSAHLLFGGAAGWHAFCDSMREQTRMSPRELTLRAASETGVQVLASALAILDEDGQLLRVRVHLYDLSAHKRVEEQLSQSQKIEAVGRLAGGIAHDFNNLLLVIGGQGERLLEQLDAESPLRPGVEAMQRAAERAAGLTQQLLAFSRRQVLSPRVLSVNAVVTDVHAMLTRVIGEDVVCALSLAPGVRAIKADPGRLEQILMNLAVNARDAMPSGGTLTIGTDDVVVDAVHARQHLGMRPGDFVRLSVSDTGCGMTPEIQALIFEPFFTTKEVGKGTGLGLSMVYGIVKQSGGYISVYSETGIGTTFRIYLPVADEPIAAVPKPATDAAPRGTETILLVEDEEGVRDLLEEVLTAQGYKVFAASRGVEALQISQIYDGPIHLLITDVVMPHMSGPEVAQRVSEWRPGLRILYLSGYTDEAIAQHGIVDAKAAFLQKPFSQASLARKLREVLSPSV